MTNSMCLAITQGFTAHEQRKISKHTFDWNKDLHVIIGINELHFIRHHVEIIIS